jgi:hypothetical protein
MPSKRLLTMDRQGEFNIYAYGSNHCGVVENLQVKYRMICECEARLDKRGFLFDQINVDNYFKSIKRSKLSCEKLTVKCVRELVKAIKLENPKCVIRKVDLTLSPAPFLASMTYTWDGVEAKL